MADGRCERKPTAIATATASNTGGAQHATCTTHTQFTTDNSPSPKKGGGRRRMKELRTIGRLEILRCGKQVETDAVITIPSHSIHKSPQEEDTGRGTLKNSQPAIHSPREDGSLDVCCVAFWEQHFWKKITKSHTIAYPDFSAILFVLHLVNTKKNFKKISGTRNFDTFSSYICQIKLPVPAEF
jgi:hypothetical protein